MNQLLKQLIRYEQFGDLEQLEVFIQSSGASILAEELGDLVVSGMVETGD